MNALQVSTTFGETLRIYNDGNFTTALDHLQALLAQFPEGGPNWFALMGNILFKLGRKEEAGDAFVREADVSPEKAAQFLKLAIALYAQHAPAAKIAGLADRAFEHLSGDPSSMYLVGEACFVGGDLDRVEKLLNLIDLANPQHVGLKCNFHRCKGDREALWQALTDGVQACPNDVFLRASRYAEARVVLNFPVMREYEALMESPDTPLASALLSAEMALNRLFWCHSEAIIARPSYDSNMLLAQTDALRMLRHPRRLIGPSSKPLKVAYLSNDFQNHAVMSVFSEVLARHDPKAVELTLLCHTEPAAAEWQKQWPPHLRSAVVSIHGKPTVEVLDIIRRLEIDVLVDLKGHTHDARLDIVNLADAPLKVSFLGYPAAVTGAELDYAITDLHITPDSSKPYYVEKLCRLPHSSMPNRTLESCMPRPASRADWGLPEGAFVFSSFNATYKISPQAVGLWSQILVSVPGSVLWIRCDDALARSNFLSAMRKQGIAEERIIFAEGTRSYQDHIDRVALADLSLDTMPYNGHATTTDMLRAGVPVVALRGSTAPSRMTEGLLAAVGLSDMIAETETGYISIAVTLGNDPVLYRAMRDRLHRNRIGSTLFDPDLFARHLEKAYAMMAQRVRSGMEPDDIDVPSLVPREHRTGEAA